MLGGMPGEHAGDQAGGHADRACWGDPVEGARLEACGRGILGKHPGKHPEKHRVSLRVRFSSEFLNGRS